MFERITQRARGVIVLAQKESGPLRRGYVGSGHPLLEPIRGGDSSVSATVRR